MGILGIIVFLIGLIMLIIGAVNFVQAVFYIGLTVLILGVLIYFLSGFRTVRPTQKGIVERFGKYMRTRDQGLSWIIPAFEKMYKVNITEQMVDIPPQMVITRDKLNAEVDAVVYYKIVDVKASVYNVDNHCLQLTSLARTTLRAVTVSYTHLDVYKRQVLHIQLKIFSIIRRAGITLIPEYMLSHHERYNENRYPRG